MMTRAYIVEFSEPGQVADAYNYYFVQHAFLLNTSDKLDLHDQIKVRFNFPDGIGTNVMARVVSVIPDKGYGLHLADNEVFQWLLDKAKTYADQMNRYQRKGTRTKDASAPPEESPAEAPAHAAPPPPEDDTSAPPAESGVVTRPVAAGPSESAPEEPNAGPSTRRIGSSRPTEPSPPPQAVSAHPQPEGAAEPARGDDEARPIAPGLLPSEGDLVRRVQEMDAWLARQQKVSGATVQAAPPPPPPATLSEEAGELTREVTGEEQHREPTPPPASKEDRIRALSASQKKKLAISGGEEERAILVKEDDTALHIWVLKNPGVTEEEVAAFAKLANLSSEAIHFILHNRRWGTSASVARNLALNPSTPPEAIPNLLTVLPVEALKALVDAADVRHLVSRQARRILMERSQL